ncbi:hypothetical protein [Nocardia inohanensis]|uniref:hypothetical protein n=1 Tax=Nocardia inohanensis TaxID=209246 RepID=UPI000AB780EF|nr:hypothetical protein [Nocardia inohanensis]
MKSRRTGMIAACFAAGVVTTVTAAATANAAPEPAVSPVSYHASVAEGTVVVSLEHGSFTRTEAADAVRIRDAAGAELDSLPLTYLLDEQRLPIRDEISADGRTLRLTPDLATLDRRELHPVASPLENQLAMNDLINAVSIGTSVGSLIGTAIGAVLGVGVGFAVAGASCLVLSLGCVVAVLPIVSLVGGVGGLAGLVLGGGPTAAYALYQYVTALNAAPGQSIYAQHVQGKPGVPAAAGN